MPKIYLVVLAEEFDWNSESQKVYAKAGVRMIQQYHSLGICRVEAEDRSQLSQLPGVLSVEEEHAIVMKEEE